MTSISITEFADKLNELMPEIARGFFRRQTNELFKGKITLPQFFILDFVTHEGESKMSDIAHFLIVSTAAATGLVERLVRCGYVVRVFDPQDRRIVKIKLSSKGGELVKKINGQKRRMIIDIFGKISDSDRSDYLRILMQIKDILYKDAMRIDTLKGLK